jgi:hypothetical protein
MPRAFMRLASTRAKWRRVDGNWTDGRLWWTSNMYKYQSQYSHSNLTWDIRRILAEVFKETAER